MDLKAQVDCKGKEERERESIKVVEWEATEPAMRR